MPDFVNSISTLQEHSSDKEKLRVWNQLIAQAKLRYETSATGTTDGAGTWLTLWSATVPMDTSVGLRAELVGRGSSIGALFETSCGFQNFAGTTTYIGATFSVTVNLSDVPAIDVRWAKTGSLVSLDVRDDGFQAMSWSAFIMGEATV
jgi:hypothetical protein